MPDSFDDPVLGWLEWDDAGQCWIGELTLSYGRDVEVFIEFAEDADDRKLVLDLAHAWSRRLSEHENEYRRATIELMGHEDFAPADLESRLLPASLVCNSDGTARIYWDEDDSFHPFYTQLDVGGKCVDVSPN